MTHSTIITLINDNFQFNHTTYNMLNISNASYRFVANDTSNKLCFDSVYNTWFPGVAPGMDNISVVRLSPDQDYYAINCTTDIDYDSEVVYLNCPLTNAEISYYLAMLQNYISV